MNLSTQRALSLSAGRLVIALALGSLGLAGCGEPLVTGAPQTLTDARPIDGGLLTDAAFDARSPSDALVQDAYSPDDAWMPDAAIDAAAPDVGAPDAWLPDAGTDGGPPGTVALGAAGTFAVLAGASVSSTGFTTITGDVGISPGTALTGFPPGVIVGVVHPGDTAASDAMAALTMAYDDATARSLTRITVAGNLGGQTLPPGLYTSSSSLAVSSGDLTLDGGGDDNAVWIFQAGSTFTMTAGRQVRLTGGATAANVYWQVGTSATIGTNAVLAGNLLADQSITLQTGATLHGRALTRIGAVTLDAAIVVRPLP